VIEWWVSWLSVTGLYVGRVEDLEKIFNVLKGFGYLVVGPKVSNGVIRLEELKDFSEFPKDVEDVQYPGRYSLVEGGFFRHGPDSPKKFLYPSELLLFKVLPDWSVEFPEVEKRKIAFLGIKPCDLAAIKVMDRVQGSVGDEFYKLMRKDLITIVENCVKPGNTCFCATMGSGPRAREGFDLAYTRVGGKLVLEAGSELGVKILNALNVEPIDNATYREFENLMLKAYESAKARFDVSNLPELLDLGVNSPVFKDIAEKCLGCANCNLVCPTCFCFDVIDVPNLDGSSERVRVWDGCLTYTYAQVAGGHFRPELWARYRHWLLHKFSYWVKQFGTFGCVGCGRCVTWCPAGIDIRESVFKVLEWVRKSGST